MNDTSPAVLTIVREMLMQRSGPERLLMGFDMYDSARALLEAGLRAEGLVEGTLEWRRRFLQRMYGGELGREAIERIAGHS